MQLNLNGYTDLPAGKIAAVVTYFEMTTPPAAVADRRDDLALRKLRTGEVDAYRDVYRRVGEEWLWFSRLSMAEKKLRKIIEDPLVDVYFLGEGGEAKGLLELDRRTPPDIELAFFGVCPEMIGNGAGRWLMSRAIELTWAHHPRRFWLHTCTLDHPRALEFYMRSGFRPYKRAIEVADDPRLTGALPIEAGARVPVIRS